MATQGTAPRKPEPPGNPNGGWADPAVVPLRNGGNADPHTKLQVDKRAPARGIALGLALSGLLWAVALYIAFRMLH